MCSACRAPTEPGREHNAHRIVFALMRATLIHNPTAGTGRPGAEDLIALLEGAGYEPTYLSTRADGIATALADPGDLIVVAGGDGTVAKVAIRLEDGRTPLAILPLGTANNIARSLGIGPAGEVIREEGGAAARCLDVWLARGSWGSRRFVEAVGLGALADAIARVDARGGKDPEGGLAELKRVLATVPPMACTLTLDGEVRREEVLLLEATNLARVGPSLCLAPPADPGDGLLDVVWAGADRREALLAWLDLPEPTRPPPVMHGQARRVELLWEEAIRLRIDDAPAQPTALPGSVVLEAGARVRVVDAPGSTSRAT
jgi:diacylglycerol kinase family enzyme